MKSTKNSIIIYLGIIFVCFIILLIKCIVESIGIINNKVENFSNQEEHFTNNKPIANNNNSKKLGNNKNNNQNKKNNNQKNNQNNKQIEKNNNDKNSNNSISNKNSHKLGNNNQNKKIEEMKHLEELNNKDLDLSDFYPTNNLVNCKTEGQMLNFTYQTDLFHQIIPMYREGYLGIIYYEPRIVGIYYTNDLSSKKWQKINNSMPEGMLRPVFLTYDQDRKLMGIFEEKDAGPYILSKYHIYKKESLDNGSEWKYIEKTKICSVIYDDDDRLIGLDEKGRFYKKTNTELESEWEKMNLNFVHIPMRRLIYEHSSGNMLGLGTDFRIYRKKFIDWKNSEWDTINGPTNKSLANSVRDIFYDFDGSLCGLARIGLVRKENDDYLSDFNLYDSKPNTNEVSIFDIIYTYSGIRYIAQYDNNNNKLNNVYVDGKKISDYQFKDPKLNDFINFRMKLKNQCRKVKALKIQEEDNKKEKDEIRNQQFNRILQEQKDTIDNLMDTISTLKENSFS